MSSQSSDDIMSYEFCSQDSNANVDRSHSPNTPILEFASLCLFDQVPFPRWRPQNYSDYDSNCNAAIGKQKQRSLESETGVVQQKKLTKDEKMECQEVDAEYKVQSELYDTESEGFEADNEEEEELESEKEISEEPDIFHMDEEPVVELSSTISLIQPFTSGLKRKNNDELESVTVTKLQRISSNSEENN